MLSEVVKAYSRAKTPLVRQKLENNGMNERMLQVLEGIQKQRRQDKRFRNNKYKLHTPEGLRECYAASAELFKINHYTV